MDEAPDFETHELAKCGCWNAALAKFKPNTQAAPKINVTFGDCLSAEIFSIRPDKGTSKYEYRSTNHSHVLCAAKIDASRIQELSVDRITQWKRECILPRP